MADTHHDRECVFFFISFLLGLNGLPNFKQDYISELVKYICEFSAVGVGKLELSIRCIRSH